MDRYNNRLWFTCIFSFHRSDTFRILVPEMVLVALYTTGLIYWERVDERTAIFRSTTAIHSLIGVVLGFLLVFRTNTGYERWWEGRRLWGELVNLSRNMAAKLNAFIPRERADLRGFYRVMLGNFAVALKEHLRDGANPAELEQAPGVTDGLADEPHIPNAIVARMYAVLQRMHQEGIIRGEHLFVLDQELRNYEYVLGGCERIKNTPIPFSYSIFIKKFIFIYTLTLPVGLIHDFQFWAIPIAVFIFYVLVSLEILAEQIEDPFGYETSDLPTEQFAARIRENVRELLPLSAGTPTETVRIQ
jgi:ion channel-forming bestrophin family protein